MTFYKSMWSETRVWSHGDFKALLTLTCRGSSSHAAWSPYDAFLPHPPTPALHHLNTAELQEWADEAVRDTVWESNTYRGKSGGKGTVSCSWTSLSGPRGSCTGFEERWRTRTSCQTTLYVILLLHWAHLCCNMFFFWHYTTLFIFILFIMC